MNEKIFIVEDESIVLMEIRYRLQSLGYQIAGTSSRGEEAIKKIIQCKPDLILMDISLKGEMTGLEAAKILKREIDTPIIFLTAYADEDSLKKVKELEPNYFLLKPFGEIEFQESVRKALNNN
ncbi:MAG: two-component system response regulator [Ignavibacteriae bacterium HGW-Ignavibacteriae-2]|nr:MAG: two-component system response regulator [Ignavibacteriae bacterium HGW-Ignavibacteriae-2]